MTHDTDKWGNALSTADDPLDAEYRELMKLAGAEPETFRSPSSL